MFVEQPATVPFTWPVLAVGREIGGAVDLLEMGRPRVEALSVHHQVTIVADAQGLTAEAHQALDVKLVLLKIADSRVSKTMISPRFGGLKLNVTRSTNKWSPAQSLSRRRTSPFLNAHPPQAGNTVRADPIPPRPLAHCGDHLRGHPPAETRDASSSRTFAPASE